MTALRLYSDEPLVASFVAERLTDVSWHPIREVADRSVAPSLAVLRAPATALEATVDGPDGDLLLASLRATGVPARLADGAGDPAAVSTIRLAEQGNEDKTRIADLADAIQRWWDARGDRKLILAAPRSACAGVDRAVQIVDLALARFGPPVYVRKQIVHNEHIVADLRTRGAVFVDDVDAVPDGSVLVFSAHGVSPAVREAARGRLLTTVDATCPLVAKVHSEARHHAQEGRVIAYIGHARHEESEGTLGEAPAAMHLVESVEDVDRLPVDEGRDVAYLTQTTLAHDEVNEIVAALRRRHPRAKGPRGEDICYATTNRQRAVRAIAAQADLVLVVGSRRSSNANRLVEVASSSGAPAVLVEDATELDPAMLHGITRIGVSAAASTPESIVDGVVGALRRLGRVDVEEVRVAHEDIAFTVPASLRRAAEDS